MDFNNICRLCGALKDIQPIFTEEKIEIINLNDIFTVSNIKIETSDILPKQICIECVTQINNIIQFRKTCEEHNRRLLQLLKTELDSVSETTDFDVEVKVEDKIDVQDDFIKEDVVKDDFIKEDLLRDDIKIPEVPYTVNVETKRVTCKICQKDLSIRSIDVHMSKCHPGADERKVKCDFCDDYFLKAKLKRHMGMMHGGNQAFRCRYCKTDYTNKEDLVEHVSSCGVKKKKRKETRHQIVECDICHMKMQKGSLRLHKAVKHSKLGPVCEHCGKMFGNKLRLNEHYRSKHGYEKFKCSTCEFQSASTMAMKNHERLHRGEKPFVCDVCGAKFHAPYLLTQHKHMHRTEKNVKCDVCSAYFKTNNSLAMHKMTCHSTTLFKCSMCPRIYSCRHYAVKHLRYVHRFRGRVPPLQQVTPET